MSRHQLLALSQIAKQMLLASYHPKLEQGTSMSVPGGLAWYQPFFSEPISVYVSTHNGMRADYFGKAMVEHYKHELDEHLRPMVTLVTGDSGPKEEQRWLLLLTPRMFTSTGEQPASDQALAAAPIRRRSSAVASAVAAAADAVGFSRPPPPFVPLQHLSELGNEVLEALRNGIKPTLVYDADAYKFSDLYDQTPEELKKAGLFGKLAIEWREGRGVYDEEFSPMKLSVHLIARALGAKPDRCELIPRAVRQASSQLRHLVRRAWNG